MLARPLFNKFHAFGINLIATRIGGAYSIDTAFFLCPIIDFLDGSEGRETPFAFDGVN